MRARAGLAGAGVLGVVAASLFVASASGTASLGAPAPIAPRGGTVAEELPSFAWRAASGADHYEFELAADPGFRSPVFTVSTWNTRAAMTKMVPNGAYWWHVRAVSKGGQVSGWSPARAVRRAWNVTARLLAPANGSHVSFPASPLTLTWTPVPRAAKYLVSIATDESLSSLVGDKPIETAATSVTPGLTPGGKSKTYYWGVTPLDAQGNKGRPSRVTQFTWLWPSQTQVRLTDLRPEPETLDPQFSWNPVPGAAAYELDINSSRDFAPGSRVCCKKPVIGTTFSPTQVFKDNTYYWRVRAIDVNGNAGVWNPTDPLATPFVKVFDKADLLNGHSITNLHLRDNLNDPAPSINTNSPVVVWDQVAGAASFYYEVAPWNGAHCDWSSNDSRVTRKGSTAVTAWTPYAAPKAKPPFPADPVRVKTETLLPNATYCFRVRAVGDVDESRNDVYGDFEYLNGYDRPGFTFAGVPCPVSCGGSQSVAAGDYVLPQTMRTTTPYFSWRATAGGSWWVIVAKDREFHTIVDYAFTRIPAYAPRPTTYADEATSYYWAAIPADANGASAAGDPRFVATGTFNKQSKPPSQLQPRAGASVSLAPVFRWTPVEGALRYHFEVSQDKDFGTLLDDVVTDSTAYTSNTSYPPDVALYWRVRAEDANRIGLTWSATRTFRYHLPAPSPRRRPAKADLIPTFRWQPVVGAISYDFHIDYPDGRSNDANDLPSAAVTAIKFAGPGVWHWKIRANFPSGRSRGIHGPWSKLVPFTKTLGTPLGARTEAGPAHVLLSWKPRLGVEAYVVQISATPDFAHSGRGEQTDLTTYAPSRTLSRGRGLSDTYYWRVASQDEEHNIGAYTKPQRFRHHAAR